MAAFAGTAAATPAVLAGPMCADLAGAAVPDPADEAWTVIGGSSGAFSRVYPSTVHSQRPGARAPGHDLQWLDRIHVIPRRVDLGFLLSEQAFTVEVWNAFLSTSKTLTAINVTGSAGITVDNPEGLPKVYPGSRSNLFTVHALVSGDPAIDNRITWVFAGVSTSGTDLLIVGSRLVPWPFRANREGDIVEAIEFLTDVMKAWDDGEQRAQLREFPRRELEFGVILDGRDAQHANALLHNWQPRMFGVPFWHLANPITAPVTIGAVAVQVDTTAIPWDELKTLFLWRDPYTWEAITVSSVTPTQINLATPATKAWALGTLALPLAAGRLPGSQAFGWEALRLGTVPTRFVIEASA